MAWDGILRTFKDAASATKQVITDTTASATEDVPLYKIVYGAHGTDPLRVLRTTGLPIVNQRTSGTPLTGKITSTTPSATSTGNAVAVGGTGGTALPGTYVFTAYTENANVVALGDTTANAAARVGSGGTVYEQGIMLQPGDSYVIDTDDLRSWKMAVRVSGDGGSWVKVGP